MKVERYPVGVYQANCYIVYDEDSKDGFIVDPGGNSELILKLVNEKGLKIDFIILTHGHFDHIGAVNKIKNELGIPVYINENDNDLITGQASLVPGMLPNFETFAADRFVKEGDILSFGKEKAVVLETPGHTRGGITIKINDSIFTGDTLFQGSVGRTDLYGGSYEALIKSIREKLLVLSDETKVYPGHGPSTTIGYERKYNPYFN